MQISPWSDSGWRTWAERIFMVNNKTREGISELMDYLKDDLPKLTLEQAKFKQSLGLNEWDPMPEGVEYPESIR